LKPSEVISADSHQRGLNENTVLKHVHDRLKKGGHLLHESNTVLLLEPIAPKIYATHLFTQDSPLTLSKILLQFFHGIEKHGTVRLYGQADNSGIIELLKHLTKRLNVSFQPSDLRGYNWMIQL